MAKQPPFNNQETKDLATVLQNWVLSALTSVKNASGKWVFHGGTALGQAYNSMRFSEDLDFMVDPSLETIPLMNKVINILKPQVLLTFGPDATLGLKARQGDKNPACFHVVLTLPQSMSNVKVKIEFWETKSLSTYAKVTKLTRGHSTIVRGVQAHAMPAQVEVADLTQIYADKWFALTQRAELKHRDVWDLAWLLEKTEIAALDDQKLNDEVMKLKSNYPNCLKGEDWVNTAKNRKDKLESIQYVSEFKSEMSRWLPEAVSTLPDAWFDDALQRVANRLENVIHMIEQNELGANDGISCR